MIKIIGGNFKKNGIVKLIKRKGKIEAFSLPTGFMKGQMYVPKNIVSVKQEAHIDNRIILNVSLKDGKHVVLLAKGRDAEEFVSLGLTVARSSAEVVETQVNSEQGGIPIPEKRSTTGPILVLVILLGAIPSLLFMIAGNNGYVPAIIAGLGMLLYVFCLWKPLPIPFGRARWKSGVMICILGLGVLAVHIKVDRQAEIAALRETDPAAYLAKLKSMGKQKEWLEELEQLDPKAFAEEQAAAEQRKKEEKEAELAEYERKEKVRKVEIEKLVNELKGIPASELQENRNRYERLVELDPSSSLFKSKLQHYETLIDQRKRWLSKPETALQIVKWSWHKDGFDNIMMATFTIKNNATFNIKDAEITCNHSSPSGTEIDMNTRTIYEVFRAGTTRTIKDFNMGFIHPQASKSSCEIVFATRNY
ncbi:hypothetical protein [uncultured Sneathiella sp.]|jgi:hypothetical protein|uniref:hypothetical protein n=1 Tax=uncultured Sneathiella sp. TaxID=879315 RepID=UPI0030DC7D9C|tara:strand:+ start:546 stop:1805 length:1260 start_codon:yes stop_codon:yes gene_type:complete